EPALQCAQHAAAVPAHAPAAHATGPTGTGRGLIKASRSRSAPGARKPGASHGTFARVAHEMAPAASTGSSRSLAPVAVVRFILVHRVRRHAARHARVGLEHPPLAPV